MTGLKFLKVPIVLILLGVFFHSSSFSMEDEAITHGLSARLRVFVDQVKELEDIVVKLQERERLYLEKITEYDGFLDLICSLPANSNDFELAKARYTFPKSGKSFEDFERFREELFDDKVYPDVLVGLTPIRPGVKFGPGVPLSAAVASAEMAEEAGYKLTAPDSHDLSREYRDISSARKPGATIDIDDITRQFSNVLGSFGEPAVRERVCFPSPTKAVGSRNPLFDSCSVADFSDRCLRLNEKADLYSSHDFLYSEDEGRMDNWKKWFRLKNQAKSLGDRRASDDLLSAIESKRDKRDNVFFTFEDELIGKKATFFYWEQLAFADEIEKIRLEEAIAKMAEEES
ncbi:MAG: hypothetical protein KGQ54_00180 [Verrucomicrobia bacterium]|nr:hypothetical protein [Verrucomicrobiota bacterium]